VESGFDDAVTAAVMAVAMAGRGAFHPSHRRNWTECGAG
jgi:hypothetical protein